MNEWERCRPWIEGALEYCDGSHTIDDIAAGIEAKRYQFWPGKNAAVVSEFIFYPQFHVLNFFLLGGDLDELVNHMEPVICEWAKAMGCKKIFGVGRKGFEKVLKPKGYRPQWLCCVKDL